MFSPLFGFGFLELLYLGLLGLKLCELRPLVTSTLGYLGLWAFGNLDIFVFVFMEILYLGLLGTLWPLGTWNLLDFALIPLVF